MRPIVSPYQWRLVSGSREQWQIMVSVTMIGLARSSWRAIRSWVQAGRFHKPGYRDRSGRATSALSVGGVVLPRPSQESSAVMAIVTIPRHDVAPEGVSRALRLGPGTRYHVPPESQATYAVGVPSPGDPDAIVVGIGSGRLWRTKVHVSRRGGQTDIQVASTPAVPLIWPVNRLSITRKVHRVLRRALGLGGPASHHETDTLGNADGHSC
jgi:hypothetical protein